LGSDVTLKRVTISRMTSKILSPYMFVIVCHDSSKWSALGSFFWPGLVWRATPEATDVDLFSGKEYLQSAEDCGFSDFIAAIGPGCTSVQWQESVPMLPPKSYRMGSLHLYISAPRLNLICFGCWLGIEGVHPQPNTLCVWSWELASFLLPIFFAD
jgi:hypothetical protein